LIQRPLIWKALAYRVVAIAFTALFTGIKQSLEIHIGLTLIYYLFDLAWERITPRRSKAEQDGAAPATKG
jgi:hypothetical protein